MILAAFSSFTYLNKQISAALCHSTYGMSSLQHTQKTAISYQEGLEIDFPLPHTQQMFHINI